MFESYACSSKISGLLRSKVGHGIMFLTFANYLHPHRICSSVSDYIYVNAAENCTDKVFATSDIVGL